MKNEWATLFLKPAKSDFLMLHGYIYAVGAGALMTRGGGAIWFGLALAILALVIIVITPRAALMDLEESQSKKSDPVQKPLRGTFSFGWWRPLPRPRKHV